MRVLVILATFFLIFGVQAQGVLNNLGNGKAAGLNGINTVFSDTYALTGNQAGIALAEHFGAFAYAEQRFLIPELAGANAGVIIPSKAGSFGISLGYFGFENFNEQKIGLAYGRKLLENLTIGGQFDFFNQQSGDFGSTSIFTFELGLQYLFNDKLTIGIHTINPLRVGFSEDDVLTSNFKVGLKYAIVKNVHLLAELEKDLIFDEVFRAGIIYNPIQNLEFRMATSTNPTSFSMGIGYKLKNGIGIDLASNFHQILGFTPSAGFIYQVNRQSKSSGGQ